MSASIGVYVATAMFLAIGGDTEEDMKHDVWRQAGLCVKQCHWLDESPECKRRLARNLPCEVNHPRAIFWDSYRHEPERPWDPRSPSALWEQHLLAPQWVPSAEPTAHRRGDQWMKLRL
jgi:hypothetical protein